MAFHIPHFSCECDQEKKERDWLPLQGGVPHFPGDSPPPCEQALTHVCREIHAIGQNGY